MTPAAATIHVFDPALARHSTRILAVAQLVDPLHVTDAPNTVAAYRSCMEQGDRFPPIAVVRLFGTWFVADGHKRFTAYRALGRNEILVEVWPVSRWLRDHADQGRATIQRWAAVFFRRDPTSPRLGKLIAAEVAHLRRIVVCLLAARHR